MADLPLSHTSRLRGESPKAYHAYTLYRDLGPKRSLAEVTRLLALEQRGSGLRIVGTDEPKQPKGHKGNIGAWSRKFRWVERAAQWDALLDQRLRQKQLDEIEAMAKRQAQQAQIGLEVLMAPVLALARALRDPNRAVSLETASLAELLDLSRDSLRTIPRLQRAERIARGCRVIDREAVRAEGSPQGGYEWTVSIHQPERSSPEPTLEDPQAESDEWEEAK